MMSCLTKFTLPIPIIIVLFFVYSCNPYSPEDSSVEKTPLYLNLFFDPSEKQTDSRISSLQNAKGYILSETDLNELRYDENLGEEIWNLLKDMQDSKYPTEEEFLLELESVLGAENAEKHQAVILQYAYSVVETLVIDVRRIAGDGVIGAQSESRIIYPQEELSDEELMFLLDPGKVQILIYSYDKTVFQNGNFLPNSFLPDLRYFISSGVIEIQPGQVEYVKLQMQEIYYEKLYVEKTSIEKEGENNFRIRFNLPAVVGDLGLFLEYNIGYQRFFNQTFDLKEIKAENRVDSQFQYEILLEDPPVAPHVFRMSVFSENSAQLAQSDVLFCPIEVCGQSPLRVRFSTTKLLKNKSFSEGFRFKLGTNRLNEGIETTIYASQGPVTFPTLQAILREDERALKIHKIASYRIPELVKPHVEFEAFVFPDIWQTMGADFSLSEVSYIYFPIVMESPSTGEKAYYFHESGFESPLVPYVREIVQSVDQESFLIEWALELEKIDEALPSFPVDIEIYDSEGSLVRKLKDQTSLLKSPEKMLNYETQVDYGPNGLSPNAEYYVRIRLAKQPSNVEKIISSISSLQDGSSAETAIPVDQYIANAAGFVGTNQGQDEYFSVFLEAGTKLNLTFYGVTVGGESVFLTPQLLDSLGNSVQGSIVNEVQHEFAAPDSATFIVKLLKPDLDVTPLEYRLLLEKKLGDTSEPPAIVSAASLPSTVSNPRMALDPDDPGMVLIRGGTFEMGGDDGSHDASVHTVTISSDYYISDHEVTVAEFHRYISVGIDASRAGCYDPDCPIVRLKWSLAQSYISWLNENHPSDNKKPFRLCTEAEWEYAARAGTTTRWSCGDDDACLNKVGWHAANSGGRAHPVKSLDPNPWGLYDMHGNVFEWVQDGYGPYPTGPVSNPTGPETPTGTVGDQSSSKHWLYVLRGGSWLSDKALSGSAFRYYELTGNKERYYGFRLCHDN
ncbi:MAG: formylglycine-generating enzyme family protein [SAR324 cluster bacterium]|nr:formylglycine-generating enzyme family protein [SAR324 cluster bacterium]